MMGRCPIFWRRIQWVKTVLQNVDKRLPFRNVKFISFDLQLIIPFYIDWTNTQATLKTVLKSNPYSSAQKLNLSPSVLLICFSIRRSNPWPFVNDSHIMLGIYDRPSEGQRSGTVINRHRINTGDDTHKITCSTGLERIRINKIERVKLGFILPPCCGLLSPISADKRN